MRQGLDSLTRYASGSQAVSKKRFSTTENTQHPYMHQKTHYIFSYAFF